MRSTTYLGGFVMFFMRQRQITKFFLVLIFIVSSISFVYFSRRKAEFRQQRKTAQMIDKGRNILSVSDSSSPRKTEEFYESHPFENACKFPVLSRIEPTLYLNEFAQRFRSTTCTRRNLAVVSRDRDGYFYVHDPSDPVLRITLKKFECKAHVISGALYPKTSAVTVEEKGVKLPQNVRFQFNAENFVVRCHNRSKVDNTTKTDDRLLYDWAFVDFPDRSKPKHTVIPIGDYSGIDDYGIVRKTNEIPKEDVKETRKKRPYSISILAFDSASRNQWVRHMPRSYEFMQKLGFITLYGYNKVGDNSAVNLIPMLAGDIKEALDEPPEDDTGNVNIQSILPSDKKINPETIDFLWNRAKELGCTTMLNDDICSIYRGLFHYPANEFVGAFKKSPTDYYYRPYYVYNYGKWKNQQKHCDEGRLMTKEYIDIWRHFTTRFRDRCQFGFSFLASLTHDNAASQELVDEYVRHSLEQMYLDGVFNETIVVMMGDHGNRVGVIQWNYAGRIEERMPLFSIYFPSSFQAQYPNQMARFRQNRFRFVGNFDIHKTLQEIVESAVDLNSPLAGRGESLFRPISSHRTCKDAYVAKNFCTCMEDRSNLTIPSEKVKINYTEVEENSLKAFQTWLKNDSLLSTCLDMDSLKLTEKVGSFGISHMARHGMRDQSDWEKIKDLGPRMDVLYHEYKASVTLTKSSITLPLIARIRHHVLTHLYDVNYEPLVIVDEKLTLDGCSSQSLHVICQCLIDKNR